MLIMQNQTVDPLELVLDCGQKKGRSKINDKIKRNMYAWVTRHPQVVQSQNFNHCLKVIFYDQAEPQLVPKLLLQVSFIILHNSLVSYSNDGGIKDAMD